MQSITDLDQFRMRGDLPTGYPANVRRFFSPVDNVHGALMMLLKGVQHSLKVNMYGYDDDDANAQILQLMNHPNVFVQMSLDKTQAGGVHERKLLASFPQGAIGTSIAIGSSAKHAISHLKVAVIDGLWVIQGSTNWSDSGESKQDNEMTVIYDPYIAAETVGVLDFNHSEMLRQMSNAK
jgi:PLD-like domain